MNTSFNKFFSILVLTCAVYYRYAFETTGFYKKFVKPARSDIPDHLLGHEVVYKDDLISEETTQKLLKLFFEQEEFPNVLNADLKTGAVKTVYSHIGEATPLQAGGGCSHPFLAVNPVNDSECVLPGRVDVGRHFVQYGGPDAMRESYKKMVNRLTSFFRYYVGKKALDELSPDIQALFEEPKFKGAATAICPKHKQYLDPFGFNFVIQIPGQTVATHTDAPYFWGANRQRFPQWLLIVMKFSGLFEKEFIDQVQVVAYLSDIDTKDPDIGGEFLYYRGNDKDGKYESVPATYRAGSAVDGSKTVHAARIYQPNAQVPMLDKDLSSSLIYTGGKKRSGSGGNSGDDGKTTERQKKQAEWLLDLEGQGTIAVYNTTDLRISIVYRARCFAHQEEAEAYHTQTEVGAGMSLETILRRLVEKMDADENRGSIYEGSNDQGGKGSERVTSLLENTPTKRLQLAIRLMDHFVRYPLPTTEAAPKLPLNYCALPRLLPTWLGRNSIEIC